MERIHRLNRYQKWFIMALIVMVVVFTGLYAITISKVGFAYHDQILVPSTEQGTTIYTGKIYGQTACFTVFEDKTVLFQYGDITYGPYTSKEDSTAIPQDAAMADYMTGVEIYKGTELLFRGGVADFGDDLWLYDEDGGLSGFGVTFTMDGTTMDGDGNEIDVMEPSATTILRLMTDPQLTHNGDWMAWFGGVFACGVAVILILFADELFRWNLRYQIRNAEQAEPAEWELVSRYLCWGMLAVFAVFTFIMGLQ